MSETTQRAQDEIVARLEARRGQDFLGFEVSVYVLFLDFDHAQSFLKEGTTKEVWEADGIPHTDPVKCIADYMPFAWKKANDCRGISASRSVYHMVAWVWLAGDDEFYAELEAAVDGYHHYGKEVLILVCEHYGLDWKQWDNGVRTNSDE